MLKVFNKSRSRLRQRKAGESEGNLDEKRRLWDLYGNTNSEEVNQRYDVYAMKCREAYVAAGNAPIDVSSSPLRTKGTLYVQDVLQPAAAQRISETFSSMIERGEGLREVSQVTHLMTAIERPVNAFGQQILDICDHPEVDKALKEYFGSYYRLLWIDSYRSHPAENARASWLWHSDNVPIHMIKMMLHFTDAGGEQGATRFLSADATREYGFKGYTGVEVKDRVENLKSFADEHGLSFEPHYHEAKAGGVLIFNNNLLHRAVPPTTTYRDIATCLILPNSVPWREQLDSDGLEKLQVKPGGWPSNPWPAS